MTARPSGLHLLLGLLVATVLAMYTTHKLYKMARIRGIVGEPRIERQVVSGKTQARGTRTQACYLRWTSDAREHRVQADCAYWKQVSIGDPIELVRLDDDDDDDDVYLRQGEIYASDGNFGFDLVLLALELAGVIYVVRRLTHRATDA